MFSQAPVLSSQKSKLLSLDEQLIRQLFYKYHTLELSKALDKQSATSHISNVSKRLQELAKAKQSPKVLNTRPPWHLTWPMRTFKASDRLTLLAKSRMPSIEKLYNPFSVAQRALTYKATERINLLAVPRKRTPAVVEYSDIQVRSTRKGFRPGHLTLRLYNLAAPKLREDTTIRRKPFTVRRSAMRAKLTPRLEQLSQPRQQFSCNWE
ncbi:GL23726 [Drosophila persimilis]|uniref:GL23726 n=1 Tax=Drosophila persimilis TaxID=7234 RepID=B4G639_DROPE|nr:GL23726 [Drosophila persimilis]